MSRSTKTLVLLALLLLVGSGIKADEHQGERERKQKTLEQVRKLRETMTVPENNHGQEGQEAARQAVEQFNSSDFQEKLRCQAERIQRFGPQQEQAAAIPDNTQKNSKNLGGQESVHLFLSSSMPESLVNQYLIDIGRTGEQRIIPVMFGLPQGMVGYFSRVLQADLGCCDTPNSPCRRLEVRLHINPVLFSKYNITEVPALVYENTQNSWSIHGDAELAFLLEKVGKAANSSVLIFISDRLRGGQ